MLRKDFSSWIYWTVNHANHVKLSWKITESKFPLCTNMLLRLHFSCSFLLVPKWARRGVNFKFNSFSNEPHKEAFSFWHWQRKSAPLKSLKSAMIDTTPNTQQKFFGVRKPRERLRVGSMVPCTTQPCMRLNLVNIFYCVILLLLKVIDVTSALFRLTPPFLLH